MMKKLILCLTLISNVVIGSLVFLPASSAFAANNLTEDACKIADADQKAALGCDQNNTAPSVATNIINAVLSVLALVSVVTIIMAGQRYMVARGDPGKVTQARNMILYGVVGLVIALLAFAIVNFILNGFAGE